WVVGDGPLRSELEEAAALRAGEGFRVTILGRRTWSELRDAYRSSSIFALASHYEGFGLVLSEASSAGLPLVAYDVSAGIRAQVIHGETGLLAAERQKGAFAGALRRLMIDSGLRKRLGAAGISYALRYSPGVAVRDWVNFLRICSRLIDGSPAR
ncbi:glycosyltransferase, partial [Actinoplanes sp. NPDC051633]|uniref:glycosyltransferase n=1 Tax=Actinoplanes sp. NPDC051633 TaxID=3155670 RepID=UPI00343ADFBE